MASEVECSQVDCLPPIPSGYYAIVNKINGNINIPPTKPTEIPVIASPEALIWKIEHMKNHDYHIIARYTGLETESAVERNNRLYVSFVVQPEIWVICGEYDPTSREDVYIIKKKFIDVPEPGPPLTMKAWVLENPHPGTQVQVTKPPFFPGPGCEVNRVPKEYTWFIRRAPVPAETQTA